MATLQDFTHYPADPVTDEVWVHKSDRWEIQRSGRRGVYLVNELHLDRNGEIESMTSGVFTEPTLLQAIARVTQAIRRCRR